MNGQPPALNNNVNSMPVKQELTKLKEMAFEQNNMQSMAAAQNKPPEFPLSICIIYCKEDEGYLKGCLSSLPYGCEVVVIETIPTKEILHEGNRISEVEKGVQKETASYITKAKYYYPEGEFDFSKARNACKSLATRDWILSIDADERLCWEKSELEILAKIDQKIGGLAIGLVTNKMPVTALNGKIIKEGIWQSFKVTRLFRNIEGIDWHFICHEQITDSILDAGFHIAEFSMLIKHIGYTGANPQSLINKLKRNHLLLCKQLAITPFNPYIMEKEFATLNDLRKVEFFNWKESL